MKLLTNTAERDSTAEWLMNTAIFISKRSKCPVGKQQGAVITLKGKIVSTGYNGPARETECTTCTLEVDAKGKDWRTCPAIHAEINAILNAVNMGVNINDCTVYITKKPCEPCANNLINAGIAEVIYLDDEDARTVMPFEQVLTTALARQRDGISRYGRDSYRDKDMHNELVEELMDVMVYAYLEILKMWELQKKKKEIELTVEQKAEYIAEKLKGYKNVQY